MSFRPILGLLAAALILAGCQTVRQPSPVAVGLNSNDLIDPVAQAEGERLGDPADLYQLAQRCRANAPANPNAPHRSVLAISGGGAYGAYCAGVLYGWSKCGQRPVFDVVTGISTGSLIAPLAFLGPEFDEQMKLFYTTLQKRDIFDLQIVRGLFTESLASNAPLARQVEGMLTPEVVRRIGEEHRKGRRLYIGTTERDSMRFVVWDVGAIASRGQPGDRDLIQRILLGSAAIPGFFPASQITVTVDGKQFLEHHVDGGTSVSVFFRPPYSPVEASGGLDDLANTDLYVIVAGKLYKDPSVIKPRALKIMKESVSTVVYAQTRGDLQRIYFISTLTGMNYFQAAIPEAYPAPKSNTDFDPEVMQGMFDEGVRQVKQGTVWRRTPPGVEPGESPLERGGTVLTNSPRSQPPSLATPRCLPGPAPSP
jgi:predicted acylesterase/phospholipase RssA